MSWQDIITTDLNEEYFPDIKKNLEEIYTFSSLTNFDIESCSLSAAVASGNNRLWMIISDNFIATNQERLAAIRAGGLAAQNNVYYHYVNVLTELKSLPERLRMSVYDTAGGLTEEKFLLYLLSASIVGRCDYCVTAYSNLLKSKNFTVDNLRDVGRIASVVSSIATIVASYTPPSGGGGDGGGL